ncbi:hypothetical protein QE152_g34834 [Popillia japonica]|uniref:Uncharacterized protein n=1 Tax=Popillia japonica TaxID=7064 RepID=A0AAW1ITJ4_POPJA
MVDLKGDPQQTPKKSKHGLTISAVKNWLIPEKKTQDTPSFRQRMPESFLRSLRRRSLRVKRTKSLVLPEKRKSGKVFTKCNIIWVFPTIKI